MTEPVDWGAGAPRSPRFDDTYFSLEDGLAESRAVFLAGCGLPERWRGRRRFTVGELGFGTGLNILALLDLWRRERPSPDARLSIFSVEGFPIRREDAERALAAWPELADLATPLLKHWPDGRRGWRRVTWPALNATLDLAVEEVGTALQGWTGLADAWFLDGFAPARNPDMWRPEVLGLVRARSAPGAVAASFTVAGAVRRTLEAEGFAVERAPGFGRKKQRLEARLAGPAAVEAPLPRVAIVGAGIAGAALARAFRAEGVAVRVFDGGGPGAGASGNPAALVSPRLDAGLGPISALHAQAFAWAVQLYTEAVPEAVIATGALQLEAGPRDAARFDRIATWDGFAEGALTLLDPASVAQKLGEASAPGALEFRDALVVEPGVILSRWLEAVEVQTVERVEPIDGGWRLVGPDRAPLMEAEALVLAAGPAVARFLPELPVRPVRGQVSMASLALPGPPAAWGGYAIPTREGLLFGATHVRGDDSTEVRADDHRRNRATLAEGRPALASALAEVALSGRAGVRAATPDHMPVAGAAPGPAGVFVLSGLGGRGFTLAPLLAEHVAAVVIGAASPLPAALQSLVDPARWLGRPAGPYPSP